MSRGTRENDTSQAPRREPICPVCLGPVYPGEHVVFGHGDLTHLQCHLGVRDLGDVVERHLRGHAGRNVCHTCLSSALEITFAEARKATARLRISAEFTIAVGRCSGCGRSGIVAKAAPASS